MFTARDASVQAWALATFGHAPLPDVRLNARLIDLAADWAARPADTIPQACGNWNQTKAAYRFLENERVASEALIKSAGKATAKACAGLDIVLAVQDTSTLNYSNLAHTSGLGPINDKAEGRGLFVHSTLALRLDGQPLGLLHQNLWCRDPEKQGIAQERRQRPIEDKESFKWLDGIFQARQRLEKNLAPHQRPRLIHIMDREGDIHEVLTAIAATADGAVIRCRSNRCVDDPLAYAYQAVRATPLLGTACIDVPRTHEQPARQAEVEVRSCRLKVTPNPRHHPDRQPLEMTLVEIWEPHQLPGLEPLHWLLWTTEPVATFSQALAVARLYSSRWRVEDMHLVLKSGCGVEKLQLETAERLAKTVVIYSSIAVRIVHLRDHARKEPEAPCTDVLHDTEWRALWTAIHQQAPSAGQQPPTMREAVLWIGRLGGHLGRKGDGMPGVRTLWRGWRDLMMLSGLFAALRPTG